MFRSLFLQIVDAVKDYDNYFKQRRDALGRIGFSTLQKTKAAIRMLIYALSTDATNEYIKIGESVAVESCKRFYCAVVEVFAKRYLRSPTSNDVVRLLHIGKIVVFQECWAARIVGIGGEKLSNDMGKSIRKS